MWFVSTARRCQRPTGGTKRGAGCKNPALVRALTDAYSPLPLGVLPLGGGGDLCAGGATPTGAIPELPPACGGPLPGRPPVGFPVGLRADSHLPERSQ